METASEPRYEIKPTEPEPGISPSSEFSRRLLAGASQLEFLNPNITLPSLSKESLGTLQNRNYTVFNACSDDERKQYWQNQEQHSFSEQKEVWMSQTLSLFTSAEEFFVKSDKGKHWANLYRHLGIDAENATKDLLEKFFEKYLLRSNDKDEGIKNFVQDILTTLTKNSPGKAPSQSLVDENLDAIEWISNVFGDKSSQVISKLTSSETRLKTNPDSLTTDTNPTLTEKEIELLEFLSKEKYKKPDKIYHEHPGQKDEKDEEVTDSIIDQSPKTEARKEPTQTAPETLTEERIAAQQQYIERIRKRYTVENLTETTHIVRFGKTRKGKEVDMKGQKKTRKEAVRLQTFLLSLNSSPKDYVTELEEINSNLPPIREGTKLSIVIPAYREEKRIKDALSTWTSQIDEQGNPIDPQSIEILVLINRPNETRQFDDTISAIEEFRRKHPEFARSIIAVEKTFNFPNTKKRLSNGTETETPDVSMGTIYRYATDLALLRNLQREGQNKEQIANHIVRTGGADAVARNPRHFYHIFSTFEQNPKLEQYVSLSDYHPDIYEKLPLLFIARHLHDEMNEYLTRGLSHIGLGTYRTSLYAEAGGFEYRTRIAEEMELSKRMRDVLRAKNRDLQVTRKRDQVLNALDDPRRDIAAIFIGKPITKAYDDFDVNEAVRTIDMEGVLQDTLPKQAELTLENLNIQANAILKFYLGLFTDPEKKIFEAESARTAVSRFREILANLGFNPDQIQVTYAGKPYEYEGFLKDLQKTQEPIDKLRDKFSVNITALPSTNDLLVIARKRYIERHGSWVFSQKT